jgi:hypothetical protein
MSGGIYTVNFDFIKPTNGRYLTSHSWNYYKQLNGGSETNIIYNQRQAIMNDICEVIYSQDPDVFDNIDCIHFTFDGVSTTQFWDGNSGTVLPHITITGSDGTVYYSNKPVSIQTRAGLIAHERMHIIGAISNYPSGFTGFPDRGTDRSVDGVHYNMFWSYDIMYHDAAFLNTHSLYGLPPITSHDLIFLGWIKPQEILEVNENNFSQFDLLKLKDVNYPLNQQQISDGYKRVLKVMVKENFYGEKDEYFLIENHQASEFDKSYANYDEYETNGYNKGILIWHIKENTNMINLFSDNYLDLEIAVPYNGWNNNPIPNTTFPRDYNRPYNVAGMARWNDNLWIFRI